MKIFFLACMFLGSLCALTEQQLDLIGQRIWHNEGGGKVEKLCHWNQGENFGSFGIGHFIWYPEGVQEKFEETFPVLIKFLDSHHQRVEEWMRGPCPWKTREIFYQGKPEHRIEALRKLLLETRSLQVQFIVARLQQSQSKLGSQEIFNTLEQDPRGLFALIDYSNFKGLGTSPLETYKGQGWGLKQVLAKIDPHSKDKVTAFIEAAKQTLIQRVQNAPPERHEERWLPGWTNRIERYCDGL